SNIHPEPGEKKHHCNGKGHSECCQEKVNEELVLAKQTILDLQNKLMYAQAESINYRKRKDEEVANTLKYANQDLIMDLLNVIGNLDHAASVKAETEKEEKIQNGIKMINQQFRDILKKYGVVEIEALGYPFDGNYMEAMLVESNPEKPDDMVLEVLMKGYKYKERVIKPAVVKVNKIEQSQEEKVSENKEKGND
ncbi:MAG: nucleotide exchange factor GrpE, partial [Bacilli bacterium]|nr:nucleotide exchange factor GrpE [Bacilli bacterium]